MKKRLSILMLLAALVVPWASRAQETVTIGDAASTTTQYSLPVNMYFNYSLTQQIFTSAEIGMSGTIMSISFEYTNTAAFSMSGVQLYMKNVNKNEFTSTTDLVPVSSSDLVWSGTLSAPAAGWVTINLNTPFEYDDSGNLLICFYDQTSGFPGSAFKWRTTATTSYLGMAYYSDTYTPSLTDLTNYSGTKTRYQYRNNIQIEISAGNVSCYGVKNLTIGEITDASLTLNWVDTNNSVATYTVYAVTATDTTVLQSGINDTTYTVTNLDGNTVYTFAVETDCGAGDVSNRRFISGRTACAALTEDDLPYSYGVEDATGSGSTYAFDQCWGRHYQGGSTNYPYPSSTQKHSGSYALYFTNSSTILKVWATLPVLDDDVDVSTLSLGFWAYKTAAAGGRVKVGVMTNPEDVTTFTQVASLQVSATSSWEYFEFPFDEYTGSGKYVAIMTDTTAANVTYIDDVTLMVTPQCQRPVAAIISEVNTVGATLTVNDPTSVGTYMVEVTGDSTFSFTLTGLTHTFADLEPNSNYTVAVSAICPNGTLTTPVYATIHTPCEGLTANDLPYTYGFEDATGTGSTAQMNGCWGRNYQGGTSRYPNPSTSYKRSGTYSLYMYNTSTVKSWATLPVLDASVDANTLMVAFYAYKSSASYGRLKVGVMTDPEDYSTFVPIASMQVSTTSTWEYFEVPLTAYAGTGSYVTIMVDSASTNYTYVDDVTLMVAPSCARIVSFSVSDPTPDGATVHIVDPTEENNYVIKVTLDTTLVMTYNATDTVFLMTGLNANTGYGIEVYSDCGDGTVTTSRTGNFRTACFAIDELPWTENFDSYDDLYTSTGSMIGGMVPCWEYIQDGSSYMTFVNQSSNYSRNYETGTNGYSLKFYPGVAGAKNFAIMPVFEESLENLELMFWTRPEGTSSSPGKFSVGYITDITDSTTFVALETYDYSEFNGAYQMKVINFPSGTPDSARIAFRHNATSSNWYWFLDDISVYMTPSCDRAQGITVENITTSSATVVIMDTNQLLNYIVTISDTAMVDSVAIADTATTFSNLSPNTQYTVSMMTDCGDGYTYPITYTFRTLCEGFPTDSLPWTENFNSYTGGTSASTTTRMDIPCWTVLNRYSSNNYPYFNNSTTYVSSGNCLYSMAAATAHPVIALPPFESAPSELMLTFTVRNATTGYGYEAGILVNPTDAESFVPIATCVPHTTGVWDTFSVTFAGYETGLIAFRNYGNGGSYLDNIVVDALPECVPPSSITFSDVTTTSATVTIADANETGHYWLYTSATDSVEVLGDTYTLNGLTSGTVYTVSVRTVCLNGNLTAATTGTFMTLLESSTVPYSTGFEDDQDTAWTLINDVHAWYRGTVASNGGTKGLYISNDGGATNAYTITTISISYAVRALEFTDTGVYNYSYDWKAYGESNYDYLRAWIAPAGTAFTAHLLPDGSSAPYNFREATPEGWIDLGGKNNLQSSWQTSSGEFNMSVAGTYYLVFMWANDGSGGTQPPAAIDNIEIALSTCPAPTALAVDSTSQNSITVHWTGNASAYSVMLDNIYGTTTDNFYTVTGLNPSTAYNVKVRALCDGDSSRAVSVSARTQCGPIALPAFFDPNDYATGSSNIPDCWARLNNGTSTTSYPYISSSSANAHTGTNVIYYYMTTTSGYPTQEIMALPEIDTLNFPMNTVEVSFWAKSSVANRHFVVGVVSNPSDITTFQPVDTIRLTTTSSLYNIELGSFTGYGAYVGLMAYKDTTTTFYVYVDDITLAVGSPCPRSRNLTASNATTTSVDLGWTDVVTGYTQWKVRYALDTVDTWTEITVNSNPYTLTGLTANTIYRFVVAPVCADGQTAFFSRDTLRFNTSQVPATLPYAYDFEAAAEWNNWQTGSNNAVNWYRGIVANGDTTNTMYLSADNGATNSWTRNVITNVAAYRDIDFGTDTHSYTLTFKYRGGGHLTSVSDGVAVLLVDPATVADIPNTYLGSPWGNIRWVHARKDSVWTEKTVQFDGVSGVKRLVFYHFNNAATTGYMDIPPAIDDIAVVMQVCDRPYDLTSTDVTPNSVSLHWEGDDTATYIVDYRLAGTTGGDLFDTVVGLSHTVTGLAANTSYSFWVKKRCDDTTYSNWTSNITVRTLCGYESVPFLEDFESYAGSTYSTAGILPDCWESYTNGTSDVYYPHITGSGSYWYPHSGSKSLTMTSGNTATYGTTKVVALPPFDTPLNQLAVSFWYKMESASNGTLTVGYVTDLNNLDGSFVAVKTITGTTTLTQDTVTFDSVQAATAQIAFRWFRDGLYYSVGIDDIAVWSTNPVPTCSHPENVVASGVTHNSATLSWTGNADGYEVAIMAGEWVEPNTGTAVANTSISYNNLIPGTPYNFGVRAVCGDALVSDWEVISFVTNVLPCYVPTNLAVSNVSYNSALATFTPGEGQTEWALHLMGQGVDRYDTVNTNSVTITGLVHGNAYQVAVRAICNDTMSAWSDTANFSTLSCDIPQNVTVTEVTGTTARVSWTATGAASYIVSYGYQGSSQNEGTQITVSTNSVVLTGLETETSYDVYVRSLCADGIMSVWSTATNFVTTAGSGPEPTYFTITVLSNNNDWGTVSGGGSFLENTTTTISATPNQGYRFVQWQDGNTDNPRTITVTADMTYTATFAEGVGIDEVSLDEVSLFPNPATSTVTVRANGMEQVSIIDLNGRTVMTQRVNTETATFDLSTLAKGTYFVRIVGEQASAVRKLVVK